MGPEHARRRAFRNRPVHVTMRMRHDVHANLRRGKAWQHARAVLRATREHLDCRIVHFAVLGNHLHLIVEAADDGALRAAMKGFAVRMARRVNACLVGANGLARKGQVFAFRYDTHVLDRPLETRNVILYVLNNAKKHAAESGRRFDRFWLDPFSSAPYFDGWIPEAEIWLARPPDDDRALVARPTHWLLTTGWRKHGLLDPGTLPKLHA